MALIGTEDHSVATPDFLCHKERACPTSDSLVLYCIRKLAPAIPRIYPRHREVNTACRVSPRRGPRSSPAQGRSTHGRPRRCWSPPSGGTEWTSVKINPHTLLGLADNLICIIHMLLPRQLTGKLNVCLVKCLYVFLVSNLCIFDLDVTSKTNRRHFQKENL